MAELDEMEKARLENIRQVKAEFAEKAKNSRRQYFLFSQEQHLIGALIDARQRAGLTQVDLASRVSCTRLTIARIETGKTTPTVRLLLEIARALGLGVTLLPNKSINIDTKPEKLYW